MTINVHTTALPGVLVIEPRVFCDARGYFFESYNAREFASKSGITAGFVQDNHTRSIRNVLRGMHYQIRQPQGKLVHVTSGEVFDVVIDLRKNSPTFSQWIATSLSADHTQLIWIPPGFAHGFLVLSEFAEVHYKTTDYWAPDHERCIAWDDPLLNITWPLRGAPILSLKDRKGTAFADAEIFP